MRINKVIKCAEKAAIIDRLKGCHIVCHNQDLSPKKVSSAIVLSTVIKIQAQSGGKNCYGL